MFKPMVLMYVRQGNVEKLKAIFVVMQEKNLTPVYLLGYLPKFVKITKKSIHSDIYIYIYIYYNQYYIIKYVEKLKAIFVVMQEKNLTPVSLLGYLPKFVKITKKSIH